jgi:hypothetical protein
LVLTVVVALLAAPIAAAVGAEVHDSRRHIYAEQAHTRHSVTATVTDVPAAQQVLRTSTISVPARWSAAGAEHTGVVKAPSTAKTGDPLRSGSTTRCAGARTNADHPCRCRGVDGRTNDLDMRGRRRGDLFAVIRAVCDRIRFTGWQHDLDSLVGHGDGHTTNQP